jgi:hypothetical protein
VGGSEVSDNNANCPPRCSRNQVEGLGTGVSLIESESLIEEVVYGNILLALIIRHDFAHTGVKFFTPHHFSQQLAYMSHPQGHRIAAHEHADVQREVLRTQEVLFIKNGKLKVDFYDDRRTWVGSRLLQTGDVIMLISGGHGFEMVEKTDMIEVKQGPYLGDEDKIRFEPENPDNHAL